ncbi:MAG: hypothetical protein IPL10_02355 [Bacteroidetes bacterium]|nr:hypothetical protein [Bacteroidota bacterium]
MKPSDIATLADLINLKNEIIDLIKSMQQQKSPSRFVNCKTLGEITGVKSYSSLKKSFGMFSKKVGGKLLFDVDAVTLFLKNN